jgi:SAM-dependent methyltransferase
MMLSRGLGVNKGPLSTWQSDYSRIGIGFDDSPVIASRLPKIFRYTNTHLHEFPKLDLSNPPKEANGFFEFAICSEVLEHVTGDPQRALDGLYIILKPNGFAVLTVPMRDSHEEFYPDLRETVEVKSDYVRWIDNEGNLRINENPEFHGGTGDVLSFRVFSKASLIEGLKKSGFTRFEDPAFDPTLGVGELPNHGAILAFK